MSVITFNIDTHSKEPIYMQIYDYICAEIRSGNLRPGDRLPSTRQLSVHLQVSRNTVDMAYGQLNAEGYIESRPKQGYYICDITNHIPAIFPSDAPAIPPSPRPASPSSVCFDFNPNGIDLEYFPYNIWKKTMKDILYNDSQDNLLLPGDPQGDLGLRQAIAGYLHQSRGVRCDASQVIVGAGTDFLLILLYQLLGAKAVYAVENPGYFQAYQVLSHIGASTVPVSMDGSGIHMDDLYHSGASVAYVMPSHHFPTGIVMPIKRRLELLAWAGNCPDRYIIEDDYDSEFRYKGRPIPSLQGIDTSGHVIYMGTFSKALTPAMRVGYMVLPPSLLSRYRQQLSFYSSSVSRSEQKFLTLFIRRGQFERHLNRMRNVYKEKRDYILKAFQPYRQFLTISGENSGLHMLLHFKDGRTTTQLLSQAAEQGIRLYQVSDYSMDTRSSSAFDDHIILGYAALPMDQLETGLSRLLDVWFAS
ncbi:MAG TPA: PLP-dependent aminotransferase family protein [Candidatus Onthocola gallistercoris]|uniref:PLP-dependent aminotransferase family protein n=1 Tax=Candidatus Onthocola gallistercoris TaxID=2840876 RepID=A0A9D1HHL2_9FIRM|nr:PLP-dependent aminotransferase family protein [Candidatus Onthocola gallistercoris]